MSRITSFRTYRLNPLDVPSVTATNRRTKLAPQRTVIILAPLASGGALQKGYLEKSSRRCSILNNYSTPTGKYAIMVRMDGFSYCSGLPSAKAPHCPGWLSDWDQEEMILADTNSDLHSAVNRTQGLGYYCSTSTAYNVLECSRNNQSVAWPLFAQAA